MAPARITDDMVSRPSPGPLRGSETRGVPSRRRPLMSHSSSPSARSRAPRPSHRPRPGSSMGPSDDPAALCGMVRALATDAYHALRQTSNRGPEGLPDQIGDLIERIDLLQKQI